MQLELWFFEVYVVCCRNYNVQLDKHLAIYGSTAKILFGLFHNETGIV